MISTWGCRFGRILVPHLGLLADPIARQEALGCNKQNQAVAWALRTVFNRDCSEQNSIGAASCCGKANIGK